MVDQNATDKICSTNDKPCQRVKIVFVLLQFNVILVEISCQTQVFYINTYQIKIHLKQQSLWCVFAVPNEVNKDSNAC